MLVMGGATNSEKMKDVWRSDDGGITWAGVTASAGWTGQMRCIYYSISLSIELLAAMYLNHSFSWFLSLLPKRKKCRVL